MWSEEAAMQGGGAPYRTSSPDLDQMMFYAKLGI